MPTSIPARFDFSQILQPAQAPGDARQDAVVWGPNLTILAGDTIAIKTADKLAYRAVVGASDGTEAAKGFSMYSFKTDANGKVYFGSGSDVVAVASWPQGPYSTAPYWKEGIFDRSEILIGGAAASLANLITLFTAARIIELPNSFIKIG
jgi:hypothetical protein